MDGDEIAAAAVEDLGELVHDDEAFAGWLIEGVEGGHLHPGDIETASEDWWSAIEGAIDWPEVVRNWNPEEWDDGWNRYVEAAEDEADAILGYRGALDDLELAGVDDPHLLEEDELEELAEAEAVLGWDSQGVFHSAAGESFEAEEVAHLEAAGFTFDELTGEVVFDD